MYGCYGIWEGMGWGGARRERDGQNKKSGHGRTKWGSHACMPIIGVNSIRHVFHVPPIKSHVTIIIIIILYDQWARYTHNI